VHPPPTAAPYTIVLARQQCGPLRAARANIPFEFVILLFYHKALAANQRDTTRQRHRCDTAMWVTRVGVVQQ
jgi:hypothetical protein